MTKRNVLSIAGSDPSGGAGIQADMKSFSKMGVHGLTVITCITSQNTKNVQNIYPLPTQVIESQLDVLCEDFRIDGIKTGMLYDDEIIKIVSKKMKEYKLCPVVDPVMVATSGDSLSVDSYIHTLKTYLLPLTYFLTANISEATSLSDISITTIDDVKKSAKKLYELGPKNILIKGGHLQTKQSVDVFYDGNMFYELSLPRIMGKKAHGSGCSLSAVIASLLASGESPLASVNKAKHIIWSMIYKGYTPGKGSDVLHHLCPHILPFSLSEEKISVWVQLDKEIENLLSHLPIFLIPEVGMNFAYACDKAKISDDICAIDGRIVKTKNKPMCLGELNFGVSQHVSSIILTAMSFDKNIRSALNIKYSEDNLKRCNNAKLRIGYFERKNEPKFTKSTMEWGTKNTIENLGFVPDIIYDLGGVGKEPMIRILGKNPRDVLKKLKKIIQTDIR
ncbi:MAG: bifunctional hydroxymethylpyrimidine kinase/phosphomethylpyrimidine kinase [Thermoplasmatota archaeon]